MRTDERGKGCLATGTLRELPIHDPVSRTQFVRETTSLGVGRGCPGRASSFASKGKEAEEEARMGGELCTRNVRGGCDDGSCDSKDALPGRLGCRGLESSE